MNKDLFILLLYYCYFTKIAGKMQGSLTFFGKFAMLKP